MNLKHLLPALLVLTSAAFAQDPPQDKTPAAQQTKSSAAQPSQQHDDEGKRILQENCSRCHNRPEGFSPNISGTIVHHMRVRASLSKHDEEVILRFFNP
jgi:cytochrome c5